VRYAHLTRRASAVWSRVAGYGKVASRWAGLPQIHLNHFIYFFQSLHHVDPCLDAFPGEIPSQLVLQDIAGNFDPGNPDDHGIIESLIACENALIRERTLPSDFKVFLARHKARC
jgi:hypothetical protein